MVNDTFITLMAIIASSFVAAFSSGIQQKANKKDMTILQVTAEILVHAVSGVILGLIVSRFMSDIMSLCAIAGIGGLIGQRTVFFAWEFIKATVATAKKVDIEKINKAVDELEDKKDGDDE